MQSTTNQYQNSRYIVGAGLDPYPTIQAAINAANAAGGNAVVYLRPGSYTENLTLYSTVNLEGAENSVVTITGTHTPPTSGSIKFIRLTLASATNVLSSAAAGSTSITFTRCQFNTTNGYVCSLANWTGDIVMKYCSDISTKNGIITNAGGSKVTISNSIIGTGTGAMSISGNGNELFNAKIGCPVDVTDASVSIFEGGSSFSGTISTATTASLVISNSRIATGTATAITHASSSTLFLNNVVINTTNAVAIGGTGSIQFSEATFVNSKALAGTITEVLTGVLKTGEIYADTISRMKFTGFYAWAAGSTAPYFDDTTLGSFTVTNAGSGYIKGVLVSWLGGQTITGMTAGNCYFIYMDSTGTIGKAVVDPATRDTVCESYIILFQCLRDSTSPTNTQITVREDHPYSFPTSPSNYLHDVIGAVIDNYNNGANITLNGTQKIGISGADELEDHGIVTTISAIAAVTSWNKYYTNAGGKWCLQNSTDSFTGYWNNAGTATALTAGRYGVYTLYVGKDNMNTSTPTYYAVLNTAQYTNSAAASTAIANGTTARASAELSYLELAQLGYIIYSQGTSTITTVTISKSTLKQTLSTGGTNTASLVVTDVTNFNGILSASDTNVQAALDTIDNWGAGTTDKALIVGNGNGVALGVIAVGATGEILIGNTANDPSWSASPTVTTMYATTFDTNVAAAGVTLSGTTLSADGSNTDISINITAKGTGTVIIDELTLSTDLAVTEGGTGASSLTDHSVLLGSGTGAITAIAVGATGEVLIGATGADAKWLAAAGADNKVLTSHNGGDPTWETASGGGITWTAITANQTAAVDNGYICNKAGLLELALPTTCAVGKTIRVTGMNTALGWKITQSANQKIHFGTSTTTTGASGYVSSTEIHDSVELVCCVADLEFIVVSCTGNPTVY